MKTFLASFLIALAAFSAAGCDKGGPADESVADEPVPIRLTKADEGVRDASNAFGLDVFSRLYALREGKDVAFSPLSLSLALAMAAEGAEGETWEQFRTVCGWNATTKDGLGSFFHTMIAGLAAADSEVSFTSSNSLWAAPDLVLKADFKTLLERHFSAESYTVDFAGSEAAGRINGWCSQKTEGKIPRMLDEVDPLTRMMLINALLFKAPWRDKWELAKNRPFQGEAASSNKDYLHGEKTLAYADCGKFEAVALPYGNTAFEMVALLPKAGSSLEAVLPAIAEQAGALSLTRRQVEVYLPVFSTSYFTEDALSTVLVEKGLSLPFSNDADFRGISESEALLISKVLQRVQVDVTEKGTEFAAVTVIEFRKTTSVGAPVKLVLDFNRPFAYLIREVSSGAILLLGTLSN